MSDFGKNGEENDNMLSKKLLNSMVKALFLVIFPKKCVTLHCRKEKCAYLRDTRNSFCSLTLCLIKSKETMFTINFFSSSRPKRRVKHSDGRQSTSSFCGNIVTADRILPLLDEGLSRTTEYPILQDGVLSRAREYLLRLRKHHHGRESTSAICASIVTAEKVLSPTVWSTTEADRVPDASG